jgi:hypothetical protein
MGVGSNLNVGGGELNPFPKDFYFSSRQTKERKKGENLEIPISGMEGGWEGWNGGSTF